MRIMTICLIIEYFFGGFGFFFFFFWWLNSDVIFNARVKRTFNARYTKISTKCVQNAVST